MNVSDIFQAEKSSHPTTELVLSLIFNHEEHLLRALLETAARSSIILEAYISDPFMKNLTVIQPPGVQWVLILLQLKFGHAYDIFTSKVQSKDLNPFLLGISCG
jgi:hypothetical protein